MPTSAIGRQHIAIVGATSAIAERCAREWANKGRPVHFSLIGRNRQKLERIARDLSLRGGDCSCAVVSGELLSTTFIEATVHQVAAASPIDIALIAHGHLPDQSRCESHLSECEAALLVNGVSPVLWAQAIAAKMAQTGDGTLVVIGSVAGDRGRRRNYVYGAAKAMVERAVEGLQHRFSQARVRVVLVKPGPTDTPMTSQLKQAGTRLAPVEQVARDIVRGTEETAAVVYTPAIWRWIMLIIRLIPRPIFNRLDI